MKTIEIFLAASADELSQEQLQFKNYITHLNEILKIQDMEIHLTSSTDKMNEIDMYFMLFHQKIDDQQMEQFNQVCEHFQTYTQPKIFACFKRSETESKDIQTLKDKIQYELNFDCIEFDQIDALLFQLLFHLQLQDFIEFKNGTLVFCHEVLQEISLENLPFYMHHEKLNELKRQLHDLEQQIMEAEQDFLQNPESNELETTYHTFVALKSKAIEQRAAYENQLLQAISHALLTQPLSLHAKQSIAKLYDGNFEQACECFHLEEEQKNIEMHVQDLLLYIDILKAQGVNASNELKICKLYEAIRQDIETYDLNREPLIEYALFLRMQHQYRAELELDIPLMAYYQEQAKSQPDTFAKICMHLGVLYMELHEYKQAETLIRTSMQIYLQDEDTYKQNLAFAYKNLGQLYALQNQYDLSLNCFLKEYEHNKMDLASCLQSIGATYHSLFDYEQSEDYLLQSIEQAKEQKDDSTLASSYALLAKTYQDMEKYEESKDMYLQSLELYRVLIHLYPNVYSSMLAQTYSSLGTLYHGMQAYEESEKMYLLAIHLNKQLTYIQEQESNPNLAHVYKNLAEVYFDMQAYAKSEAMMVQAIRMYEDIAKSQPKAYAPLLARCYKILAQVQELLKNVESCEKTYILLVQVSTYLLEEEFDCFVDDCILNFEAFGHFYSRINKFSQSAQMYEKAFQLSKQSDNLDHEIWNERYLGAAYSKMKNWNQSIAYYAQAIFNYQKVSDIPYAEVASVYNSLAVAYESNQEYEKSEQCYEHALLCLKREFDFTKWKHISSNRIFMYQQWNNVEKLIPAYQYQIQGLCSFESLSKEDQFYLATRQNDLAQLYRQCQQYELAFPLFNSSMEFFRTLHDVKNYFIVSRNLFQTLIAANQLPEAKNTGLEVLECCEHLYAKNAAQYKESLISLLQSLIDVHMHLGLKNGAKTLQSRLDTLFVITEDMVKEWNDTAMKLYKANQFMDAKAYFDKSLHYYKRDSNNLVRIAWVLDWISLCLDQMSNVNEAGIYYQDAIACYRKLNKTNDIARCCENYANLLYRSKLYNACEPYYFEAYKMFSSLHNMNKVESLSGRLNQLYEKIEMSEEVSDYFTNE